MRTKGDSKKMQRGKPLRYLLCDVSGRYEPKSVGEEWVRTPTQCLDRAVEGNPSFLVVCFGPMLLKERENLVELCVVLKRNTCTRNTPLLALLHEKHRGLIEDLKHAGVDFIKFVAEKPLRPSLMVRMIDGLGPDDRVEGEFQRLCRFLHYDPIDDCREITVCGAYLDRMVLGGKWLHKVCETKDHLSCKYFLDPRIRS
jgi:hypothetical protein